MNNIENLVRQNILELKPYSSARDEFNGQDGIFLDANENPFGDLNRYPDPYQVELKNKLGKLKDVKSENIFIGNGSDEVIDLAFRIFCNPGIDKALAFSPSYGMYAVSAAINNVELIKSPLSSDFQIDRSNLSPYLNDPRVKVLFICSPNNPTGNLINRSDIEFILENFNGIAIIDEAYIDFSGSDSLISLIKEFNNLIICQTFSKAYGLAAARIGVAYANEEIIRLYNKVKPPYNVSKINQQTALNALNCLDTFQENLDQILTEKGRLKSELEKITLIEKVYPSDANFFLVKVRNADLIYEKLVRQKIIIRNRNNQVSNCIRITVGNSNENDQLLSSLKKMS